MVLNATEEKHKSNLRKFAASILCWLCSAEEGVFCLYFTEKETLNTVLELTLTQMYKTLIQIFVPVLLISSVSDYSISNLPIPDYPQIVAVKYILTLEEEPFKGSFFGIFYIYFIRQCLNCCPSDSTESDYAGIEPRTVATLALAVRRSNHSARSTKDEVPYSINNNISPVSDAECWISDIANICINTVLLVLTTAHHCCNLQHLYGARSMY